MRDPAGLVQQWREMYRNAMAEGPIDGDEIGQPPEARMPEPLDGEGFEMTDQQKDIVAIKQTLITLIGWMAGSANSPISVVEATKLFKMLEPKK